MTMMKKSRFIRGICAGIMAVLFFVALSQSIYADTQSEILDRQRQIDEIQRQIDEYQAVIDSSRTKSTTLQSEISKMNAKISQIQLEIRSLALSINKTGLEIGAAEVQITDSENKIEKHKLALAQFVKLVNKNDQTTLTELLIANASLSDFFNALNNVKTTQQNLKDSIVAIRALKNDLEIKKTDLEDKKAELERSRTMQEMSKNDLDSSKSSINKLLKETKGQESKYQELVKKSQKDIEAIRSQITYLAQNGITAEEAVKYGQLAAIRTGIRPAYLLAELNQESGLGINVGKCIIVDATSGASKHIVTGKVSARGINPTRDLPLFLRITEGLGKDPFQTVISCWPGYGWGGAMGPAQFIPSTWMGYRDEVTRLTGHNPANPWSIEDAFVAAASKLAHDGADSKTKAGEIAASKRYFCGSAISTNSKCVNYANMVQRKAAEIEANL
ncbi:MAG: Cell wall endopeptidase, family M23/M37 [Candidatus Yanofskybacteria bacterium GW2011_GWD2_39_48]|uniref:Cell wall endopeptidase, family M23/M37 n=1 Tax=Candidatus Yanofskybacteria bacterium GW2011_GWD2_39_48 TaxID=1619031 RepID=A0A0G0RLK3_9BACT|nr:MAG: Cell wall endopeptidase, family M23/M37 [Candidatus Yanofskybacteria bacterium GW2011_GWD2_39_48]